MDLVSDMNYYTVRKKITLSYTVHNDESGDVNSINSFRISYDILSFYFIVYLVQLPTYSNNEKRWMMHLVNLFDYLFGNFD